jgi:hypothetical protein
MPSGILSTRIVAFPHEHALFQMPDQAGMINIVGLLCRFRLGGLSWMKKLYRSVLARQAMIVQ